ncbi:FeoA family protein [Aliivibrio kagoshimensis]|uniref:FeoA family protein n=1 Tax=Aliivibrio kagoshimensis TaxID=2910230 RepID=UPI003D09C90F
MNNTIVNLLPQKVATFLRGKKQSKNEHCEVKNLTNAQMNREYEIKTVIQNDKELVNFLFTLGCFKGESITLISVLSDTYVVIVKDARYSIDIDLAKMVILV